MEIEQPIKEIPELVIGQTEPENKIVKFFKFFHPIIKWYNGKVSGGGAEFTFKIGKGE